MTTMYTMTDDGFKAETFELDGFDEADGLVEAAVDEAVEARRAGDWDRYFAIIAARHRAI